MDRLLYYPYINLPNTDWSVRTLMYYDQIGAIVPQEYFYHPEENYESFMLELVRSELVLPINPMHAIDHPWEVSRPYLNYLGNIKNLTQRRKDFSSGRQSKFPSRIHADKFEMEVFHQLVQMGLAIKGNQNWYIVETTTATNLMKFLVTIISSKLNMQPATDRFRIFPSGRNPNRKRETILTSLIPFPKEIDIYKIRKFKDLHLDLLNAFKNRVEQLVLDETLIEGTQLFTIKVDELRLRKEELTAKMNESDIKAIIFGSVCGIIGSLPGLVNTETTQALIGGVAGFAGAIYSALQIEKPENVFDQSGLKYLALMDKRTRLKSTEEDFSFGGRLK